MKKIIVLIAVNVFISLFGFVFSQETYTFQIKSEAGIHIFIDNIYKGKTNKKIGGLIINDITIGNHILKLSKNEFFVKEDVIIIHKKQTNIYDFKGFTSGTLLIKSIPNELTINIMDLKILDVKIDEKDWILSEIPVGTYECKFIGIDTTLIYIIEVINKDTIKLLVNCEKGNITNLSFLENLYSSIEYGSFVDKRDNREYGWIKVGNQTWMSDNLNIGKFINTNLGSPEIIKFARKQRDNNKIEKYCMNHDKYLCNKYGGYYYWQEAMGYQRQEKSQGICPHEWHIPSKDEFEKLLDYLGGKKNAFEILMDSNFGFFDGYYGRFATDKWHGEEHSIYLWTSSRSEVGPCWLDIYKHQVSWRNNENIRFFWINHLKSANIVRCIKD